VSTLRRRRRDSTASAPELSGPHAGTYFFLHQPPGSYRPSMHVELSGDDWGGDTPPTPRPGIREREVRPHSDGRTLRNSCSRLFTVQIPFPLSKQKLITMYKKLSKACSSTTFHALNKMHTSLFKTNGILHNNKTACYCKQ